MRRLIAKSLIGVAGLGLLVCLTTGSPGAFMFALVVGGAGFIVHPSRYVEPAPEPEVKPKGKAKPVADDVLEVVNGYEIKRVNDKGVGVDLFIVEPVGRADTTIERARKIAMDLPPR